MLRLPKDLQEFVVLLNAHQVKYPVVGGYAVAFHGYPRATGDIDFFVEVTEENARKLEAVLIDFGVESLGLTADDFLDPDTIIQIGYPPHRIDLLTFISGVSFSDAWEGRIAVEIEGQPINFVSKDALFANKAATGRPKDQADMKKLSDIHNT